MLSVLSRLDDSFVVGQEKIDQQDKFHSAAADLIRANKLYTVI